MFGHLYCYDTLKFQMALKTYLGYKILSLKNWNFKDVLYRSDQKVQFREERNGRYFYGEKRIVTPHKKSITGAKFASLGIITFRRQDTLVAATWLLLVLIADKRRQCTFSCRIYQSFCYRSEATAAPLLHGPNTSFTYHKWCGEGNYDRTMEVAKETSQEYAIVTYHLAIARTAYAIKGCWCSSIWQFGSC